MLQPHKERAGGVAHAVPAVMLAPYRVRQCSGLPGKAQGYLGRSDRMAGRRYRGGEADPGTSATPPPTAPRSSAQPPTAASEGVEEARGRKRALRARGRAAMEIAMKSVRRIAARCRRAADRRALPEGRQRHDGADTVSRHPTPSRSATSVLRDYPQLQGSEPSGSYCRARRPPRRRCGRRVPSADGRRCRSVRTPPARASIPAARSRASRLASRHSPISSSRVCAAVKSISRMPLASSTSSFGLARGLQDVQHVGAEVRRH